MTPQAPPSAPPEFADALLSLRHAHLRPEVHLEEIPAPVRLAPFAAALTAELTSSPADLDPDGYLGSGRFVVLHDPQGQDAWHGTFRVICMLRANLDAEMGDDPLLGEVAWSWLTDALAAHDAPYHHLSGTVTRVLSESFGGLDLAESQIEIELRASWTPQSTDLGPHLRAWGEAAGAAIGLEPVPANVTSLARRR